MTIQEYLDSLSSGLRERVLGRIEGMSMAMRLCRNRAVDVTHDKTRADEATICAMVIRHMQVEFGSGRFPFGELTADEWDEIWRIYT